MALRLRRGTDAERLLITPVEGELIYTTDTKLLYVGDGTTVGGIIATGQGGASDGSLAGLSDTAVAGVVDGQQLVWNAGLGRWVPADKTLESLNDVVASDATDGQVLTWDNGISTWVPTDKTLDSLDDVVAAGATDSQVLTWDSDASSWIAADPTIGASELSDLTDVDTLGLVTGDVLAYDGAEWVAASLQEIIDPNTPIFADFNGDLRGSVFGDDSTLLVDSETGMLLGDIETNQLVVKNELESVAEFRSISGEDISFVDINVSKGTFESPTTLVAGDSGGGIRSKSWDGSEYKMNMAIGAVHTDSANFADNYPAADTYIITAGGGNNTPVWTFKSDTTLVAPGPIQPGVYEDAAARDAAIPTPEAGMIVFVTDVAKHQGYDGTAWNDLY